MPAAAIYGAARPGPSGAGTMTVTDRDIAGLMLCADQYGAPYDLLAEALGVRPDRVGAIVARWRQAGYADTGGLGPGPAWCWLTPSGMRLLGLPYTASETTVARLARIRAVLAVRLWLEAGDLYRREHAWWRSERRIRAGAGGRTGVAHIPAAEIHWPALDGSPYAGQLWAIEAEITPRPLVPTMGAMRALLTRTGDYGLETEAGREARYAQVVYLAAPAATPVVNRAIAALPAELQHRMVARNLPPGALR